MAGKPQPFMVRKCLEVLASASQSAHWVMIIGIITTFASVTLLFIEESNSHFLYTMIGLIVAYLGHTCKEDCRKVPNLMEVSFEVQQDELKDQLVRTITNFGAYCYVYAYLSEVDGLTYHFRVTDIEERIEELMDTIVSTSRFFRDDFSVRIFF